MPQDENAEIGPELQVKIVESTTEQEFELLYEALGDILQRTYSNTTKFCGFLILAIGWIVTSEEARAFMSSQPSIPIAGSLLAILSTLLIVMLCFSEYRKSHEIYLQLKDLRHVSSLVFEHRRLSKLVAVSCASVSIFLTIFVLFLLLLFTA